MKYLLTTRLGKRVELIPFDWCSDAAEYVRTMLPYQTDWKIWEAEELLSGQVGFRSPVLNPPGSPITVDTTVYCRRCSLPMPKVTESDTCERCYVIEQTRAHERCQD